MKKITTIILLSIFLLLTTSTLVGCTKYNNRFNTELFECMYNKDKTGVILLELTKQGKELEILVIPEEINGLPVIKLGEGAPGGYIVNMPSALQSDAVKKVYFKTHINDFSMNMVPFENRYDLDIVIITAPEYNEKAVKLFGAGKMISNEEFAPNNFYCDINQDEIIINEDYTIKKCNTYFYTEKDEIYWLDIINEKDYHVIPEEPTKMGYRFAGWYYEEECINKWDERFILPTGEDELKLYAKWLPND